MTELAKAQTALALPVASWLVPFASSAVIVLFAENKRCLSYCSRRIMKFIVLTNEWTFTGRVR